VGKYIVKKLCTFRIDAEFKLSTGTTAYVDGCFSVKLSSENPVDVYSYHQQQALINLTSQLENVLPEGVTAHVVRTSVTKLVEFEVAE
jgi:hypothetical protein